MFVMQSFIPFAQHFYGQISETCGSTNCCVSPVSVYTGLSLVLCGSASKSREELLSVLNLKVGDEFDSTLEHLGKDLVNIIEGGTESTLLIANGLFLDSEFEASEGFKKSLEQYFNADVQKVSFASAVEEARKTINLWIAEHTNEKIPELMPHGSLETITRLFLANAVYFKGTWATVFNRNDTSEKPFYSLRDGTVNVPMMTANRPYEAAKFAEMKCSTIRIPFKTHYMLIVLPDAIDGLAELITTLKDGSQVDKFQSLFDSSHYQSRRFNLNLPKFKLGGSASGSLELKEPLSAMGLKTIFDECTADLSLITNKEQLHVSKIVHQAVIEVNEEGAEAAAATGISIVPRMIVPTFSVDHPFLFFIVTTSGVPVFMGHVVNPLAN